MKTNLNRYRLAGTVGGLLLAAGQFIGLLCVFQLIALLPVMVLALRDKRPRPAALAGLYMGVACMIPQMIYLRMPVPVTAVLWVWITIQLILLCMSIAYFLPRHHILGPLAVGAVWYILDWINFTVVPIWGMAQSFARSWTAYPFAIQFISITGISGVLFVIGTLQGLWAYAIVMFTKLKCQSSPSQEFPWGEYLKIGTAEALLILLLAGVNTVIWLQKPTDSLRVAAAGWVFDDRSAEIDPHKPKGFEKLFATPARKAASQGARIFTTGELGFYIARHEWTEWMDRFSAVARDNDLWLVVGYFNIDIDENRLFFMSPEGDIVQEYTKTHLTPFEPGHKGNGDLKTIQVDGLRVGAMMIGGRLKTPTCRPSVPGPLSADTGLFAAPPMGSPRRSQREVRCSRKSIITSPAPALSSKTFLSIETKPFSAGLATGRHWRQWVSVLGCFILRQDG
ncbi:MAG: nitrilase-related carbon-nitrogen hydrolase [Planctomycetota bacterium]|jgi:apolipoprotein N-acyltransferase